MKRPDFFIFVNGGNREGLAAALAFAPTTLTLENYWARVIEPIQQAPWYNAPRPAGREMELWDARVAMLDAIYYKPPSKTVRTNRGRASLHRVISMAESDTYAWAGTFDDLNPGDRLSVAKLVLDGGAVVGNVHQIAERLKNAWMLLLLREEGTSRIVGVASLKRPDTGYRLNKFADAGIAITGYEDAAELGYVVVAEDMRGRKLSGCLVDLITKEIRRPTFATTDNETMKKNLSRSGFSKIGREWQGQKGALSLWILTPR